jgi:hypothetical protein
MLFEEFNQHKYCINSELNNEFTNRFQYILKKFKSLSKSNHYKKVQKANIIATPTDSNDTILNLLNKISEQNYDTISQKIILKITNNNILKFVDQIFVYVEKSNSNSESLWKLIKLLYGHSYTNDETKRTISTKLRVFIDTFLKTFDGIDEHVDLSKEEYIEFVERNMNNNILISKMNMIYTIILDDNIFMLPFDANVLFGIFINKLNKLVDEEYNYNDNIIFVLLECIVVLIRHPVLKQNPYAFKKFLNNFDNDIIKSKMKNKIRFKLMDIIDSIKQS